MKTKFRISALLGILIIILGITSCEKDPIIDPVAKYTIKVNDDPNGVITPSGTMEVIEGTDKTFKIKPNLGYIKDSILVNGIKSPLTDSTYTLSNIAKDYTITPIFKKMDPVAKKYTIRVTSDPNGVITPSGTMEVIEGKDMTFTVKPNLGYIKDSILVNGIKSPLTDSTYTLSNIAKDYTITPIFKKDVFFWLIVEKPWVEDKRLVFIDGSWVNFTTSPFVNYYLPNGKATTYWDGKLIGDTNWDIDQSTIPPTLHTGRCKDFPEGEVSRVEKLDETTLILVGYDNEYAIKVIYKHP